jgi:predicted MFS family arabinose efflux permease
MTRSVWTTVVLLFAAYVVDFIDRLVISNALPQIGTDLHLDHADRGLVVSVFFVAYAAVQVPGGLLADRFGAVRICTFAMLAWSVCAGLTALAWSLAALLVIRCVFGVAQGTFPAAAVKAMAERSPPGQRTTANSWVNSANAGGVLLAGLIAAWLLPTIGWRGLFLAISGLGLLVALAWARWMPRPSAPALVDSVGAAPSPWTLIRAPAIIGCAAMSFGYNTVAWGLTTWIPSYLEERRGVDVGSAALLMILPTLVAAVTIVLGGRLADRLGGQPRVIVLPAMAFVGVLELLLPAMTSVAQLIGLLTVLYAVLGLCAMASLSVPLRALPARSLGVAAGVIMIGSQVAGIVVPYLFGFVVDHWSYGAGFVMLGLGPAVAIVAAIFVPQNAEAFRAALRISAVDSTATR